jgi:hypothetical protein
MPHCFSRINGADTTRYEPIALTLGLFQYIRIKTINVNQKVLALVIQNRISSQKKLVTYFCLSFLLLFH